MFTLSKPFHKGMLRKFKSSPIEILTIAKKANQWKGTYHPWFLSSRAKNCATKPIPRQNIRFWDFGSDWSISKRESPAAAAVRGKNGNVWNLGRPTFLGTWPNRSGVADIRPGMWHISIAMLSFCGIGSGCWAFEVVECIKPLQPSVPPLSIVGPRSAHSWQA